MKRNIKLLGMTVIWMFVLNTMTSAQPMPFEEVKVDSLENVLKTIPRDTSRVNCLNTLAGMYILKDISKAYSLSDSAQLLSDKLNYQRGKLKAMSIIGFIYGITGEYMKAMELAFEGIEIAKQYAPEFAINFYTLNR